jgi:hypothetical protein
MIAHQIIIDLPQEIMGCLDTPLDIPTTNVIHTVYDKF